jgi:multiple sugar transport system ATP-binding protein
MAHVRIENLVKHFDEVLAVNGISLDVRDREFTVFLGPSGSGKTTTLRAIAGLEKPDSGDIYIDDVRVNDLPPADRDIAFVFQFYALYPHLSVYDNLAFPLRAVHMSKADIDERVREVARVLHIEPTLNRKPAKLSGGEQQRVALGRAMVRRPKVFLMDEPLTNLDAKMRAEMRAKLKRDQSDLGATTIYVTHDQVEAMSMGDRIAVMDQGRLLQVGAPEQVYDHPQNLFVAGFIGSPAMNLINCQLGAEGDQPALVVPGSSLSVSIASDLAARLEPARERLVLGIRPEDVHLSRESRPGWIRAEVYVTEPLGAETIVDLHVGGGDAASILRARTLPTFRAAIGEPIWMEFDRERMHCFDRASGQAIS